ncbi:MAG: hypothetical protein QF454_02640, partial [Candidatus Thalassarchaeaceae archaeon]|nr:hypothetical protein [Candidatus Thalassarchaeaceae archaeon]
YQLDSDGDGVMDDVDMCPTTPGSDVDYIDDNGCYEITEPPLEPNPSVDNGDGGDSDSSNNAEDNEEDSSAISMPLMLGIGAGVFVLLIVIVIAVQMLRGGKKPPQTPLRGLM